MKKAIVALIVIITAIAGFFVFFRKDFIGSQITQIQETKPKPLEKYTIENLSKTEFTPSDIILGKIIKDDSGFTSHIFFFSTNGKKVSGLINIPKAPGTYPVLLMSRGYVDKEKYQTGTGTQHSAEVYARSGYITLAPDFLGYGESDPDAESSIEARFQTYTTVLTLLSSIKNLNDTFDTTYPGLRADANKLGLWGHSNGGQITLTILEITKKAYPAVLWAPVSKPFPYSILYYTDDIDDHGKALRKVVAEFEAEYDVEKYSLTNYFARINAPIELHQGGADEAVPLLWSDQLNQALKKEQKDITYFTYPGDDHNFSRGSWNTIVARNIAFYNSHLKPGL